MAFLRSTLHRWLLGLLIGLSCLILGTSPAWAGLNDDHYDGNIFPLYAGNGSLIPPRVSLAESMQHGRVPILIYYIDDSQDCKTFAAVVSQLDAFYGRAADIVPISVDSIPPKAAYDRTEPGYYYGGYVPQTVVLNQTGKVVFNEKGVLPYEQIDDALREVFDLLPRAESAELKRRQFNEFNTELVSP